MADRTGDDPRPVQRYRIHMIINAVGFNRPVSFRTEAYARSPQEAEIAAEQWLTLRPLNDVVIVQSFGTELVPEQPILPRSEYH